MAIRKTKKDKESKLEKDAKMKTYYENMYTAGLDNPGFTPGTFLPLIVTILDKSGFAFRNLVLKVPSINLS